MKPVQGNQVAVANVVYDPELVKMALKAKADNALSTALPVAKMFATAHADKCVTKKLNQCANKSKNTCVYYIPESISNIASPIINNTADVITNNVITQTKVVVLPKVNSCVETTAGGVQITTHKTIDCGVNNAKRLGCI